MVFWKINNAPGTVLFASKVKAPLITVMNGKIEDKAKEGDI